MYVFLNQLKPTEESMFKILYCLSENIIFSNVKTAGPEIFFQAGSLFLESFAFHAFIAYFMV